MKIGRSFVGQQVIFDSRAPQNITIGNKCVIAMRSIILTHYVYSTENNHSYTEGKVTLGDNVFIGANSVIAAPISIGDNAIVGAGSIVTKNIPANEVWAGVPARFIKKIDVKR